MGYWLTNDEHLKAAMTPQIHVLEMVLDLETLPEYQRGALTNVLQKLLLIFIQTNGSSEVSETLQAELSELLRDVQSPEDTSWDNIYNRSHSLLGQLSQFEAPLVEETDHFLPLSKRYAS